MGVAVFVELEQLGRQRLAAGMALALVLIDADFQLSCYGNRPAATLGFVMDKI